MSTSGVHMFVSAQIVADSSAPPGLKTGKRVGELRAQARDDAVEHGVELSRQRVGAGQRRAERVVEAQRDDLGARSSRAQLADGRAEVGRDRPEQRRRVRGDAGRVTVADAVDDRQRVVGAEVDRDRLDLARMPGDVAERIRLLRREGTARVRMVQPEADGLVATRPVEVRGRRLSRAAVVDELVGLAGEPEGEVEVVT